ncbi:MAG: nitrite/sulfite reductase [Euryarchaeota archaeon]|nr:nitrite/sulfite reductase [Euryarchaeota archaeon]
MARNDFTKPGELDGFHREVERFQRGEIPQDAFRAARLQQGVYGQRAQSEAEGHMVRIKLPAGNILPEQLECIAVIADQHTHGKLHVTTRQNIQLHWAALEDAEKILRRLETVGLTTREACGNTVRNVTACPHSGIHPGEVFDVWPYARATASHFLRHPVCQNLPRKFKFAFVGHEHDCMMTGIHDVGLIAATRPRNGGVEKGFRVVIGGGLGGSPRKAKPFMDFMPVEEMLATFEAIVSVQNQFGERKNRNRSRMKFLIEKLGMEEFRRRWQKEYDAIRGQRPLPPLEDPGETPVSLTRPPVPAPGFKPTPTYERWLRTNTSKQKQPGYAAVTVRLIMGDFHSEQARALARLLRTFGCHMRTSIGQDLILRWVREADLPALYRDLHQMGLAMPGAATVENITVCPGADTCNLAITASKGVGRILTETLSTGEYDDLGPISIKISGCFNSCGQHHIANIGLFGASKRAGDREVPHYMLLLGGQGGNGSTEFGELTTRIPAKTVPRAIRALLDLYRRKRQPGETFNRFIHRYQSEGMSGKGNPHGTLKEFFEPYTRVPPYEKDPSYYQDWGAIQEFSLKDVGAGECAGVEVDPLAPNETPAAPAAKRA